MHSDSLQTQLYVAYVVYDFSWLPGQNEQAQGKGGLQLTLSLIMLVSHFGAGCRVSCFTVSKHKLPLELSKYRAHDTQHTPILKRKINLEKIKANSKLHKNNVRKGFGPLTPC